jgi:KaiC domain protein
VSEGEDWFDAALDDDEDPEDVDWDDLDADPDDVDWDALDADPDDVDWDDLDADGPPGTGAGATDERDDDGSDGDDGMFEDGFANAMGNAPADADDEFGVGDGSDDFGTGGSDDEFGMGDGSDDFGMAGGDDEFGMGGDDFGMAGGDDEFGMGDAGDEFGMGGGGGFGMGGGEDFDEEEFESDIPRIDLGIDGLDEMIQGGVPERSLLVAIGSAGTGKTTFGMQFLDRALAKDERAIYITLEESRERVLNSATEKGMPFDEYAASGQLAIVDIDPVEMANSLTSIRSELPRLIEEFGASRLVLDSVSLLEMMYDDKARRRNEVYDFTKSLKAAGVTTMLTSEASEDSPYVSRHGIVEYLTDGVFILQYVRPSNFQETRLAIEIQKIRDANHSRETKPYDITGDGISVYQSANIF